MEKQQTKTPTSVLLLIAFLVLVIIALLFRFVIFADQFNEVSAGLQRMEDWKQEYRQNNPNATEAEVDAALQASLNDLSQWRANYRAQNPDATEEDIDRAWREAWNR